MTQADQLESKDSINEQPEGQESTTSQDWVDYEKKYKELQSDYTRKAQELAELKKGWSNSSNDLSEDEQVAQYLKKNGFVTREELEEIRRQDASNKEFDVVVSNTPELKKYETAIKQLQKTPWLSYDEVLTQYWFMDTAKLEAAKQRDLKGVSKSNDPVNIRNMSSAEYEKFKKAHGIGTGWTFTN